MKTEVNKKEGSKVEMKIELSNEEMQPYLRQAAEKISREMDIPGFRKGKAPLPVIQQRVGEGALFEEAANLALAKSYVEALQKEKVEAIGRPEIKVEKVAPGNPFVYTATVHTMPEIKLPDYKSMKVEKKEVKVEDKDVDSVLKNLQTKRATFKEIDAAAAKGNMVMVNFSGSMNGKAVEGAEGKNHPFILGDGHFVPGFEENLEGMKKGDKKDFTVKFPKDYHKEDLRDKDVDFNVEMLKVQERNLPKLDDAFAKEMGKFKDLAELKDKVKENLLIEAKNKEKTRFENEMVKKISDKTEIEIPEVLIDGELDKMKAEMKQTIESQGGKFDQYMESIKKSEEDLKKEFRPKAIDRVKAGLILREIASTEKVGVKDSEVAKEVAEDLKKWQHDEKVMKQIQSPEYADYKKSLILNRKVFELLTKEMAK